MTSGGHKAVLMGWREGKQNITFTPPIAGPAQREELVLVAAALQDTSDHW